MRGIFLEPHGAADEERQKNKSSDDQGIWRKERRVSVLRLQKQRDDQWSGSFVRIIETTHDPESLIGDIHARNLLSVYRLFNRASGDDHLHEHLPQFHRDHWRQPRILKNIVLNAENGARQPSRRLRGRGNALEP